MDQTVGTYLIVLHINGKHLFLVMVMIEPRVLYVLGKHLTTELHPQPHASQILMINPGKYSW